ncbi:hypothetical protein LNP00_04190 [Fructobacillus sp. M158]|uniref:hypothetical protein n=1 Tax=Fructobacillus parabroussonetiae TaxID=2713174 RepID=UPI00200A2A7A|nr:hypothetical protein [Fructobacillus parabroussonetiae]MCK8617563.1 hypothetical protein [Fructobacillus parabroussonetiae]
MSFGKMFHDILTIEQLYNNICQQLTNQYIIEAYPPLDYLVSRQDSESEELEQMTSNLKALQVSTGYILGLANMNGFYDEKTYVTNRVDQLDLLTYRELKERFSDEAEMMIKELRSLRSYLIKNNLITDN